MSDNKKYYYLKLKDNFFDSPEIKVLEAMSNGYKYSNLLLKLYLKSLKFNGSLILNEYIPYNTDMIAAVTGMDVDTVRIAFDLFKQLQLIEVMDDGTIYMLDIQNFIGESSTEADRKRAYRLEIDAKKNEKKVGQGQMSGQISDKNPPEIEIEKKIEIEKEKEINSSSKENEEELLNIMRLCQSLDFKLKKVDAKNLVEVFGGKDVRKAIGIAVNTEVFRSSMIKSYGSYLGTVLKDLSREKKVDVTINKAKNKFVDYEQRPNMTKEELLWLPGERL